MPALAELNWRLAQSLQSLPLLPAPYGNAYRQAHLIQNCIHPLHTPGTVAAYCRTALCLLCRKQRAETKRCQLKRLLLAAPNLAAVFATFTLLDCKPTDVEARADLLVIAFRRLLRKRSLRQVRGWARSIEVKSGKPNNDLENVHLHAIWLLTPLNAADLIEIDWSVLWQQCADDSGRDAHVSVADSREAVLTYLTKSSLDDFREDAAIGIADPLRYVQRVLHGHAKFSCGGLLRPRPSPPAAPAHPAHPP